MTPRPLAVAAAAGALALALTGCTGSDPIPSLPGATDAPAGPSAPDAPAAGDAVEAATELLVERWELVRDGDYAAVCELYTDGHIAALEQLAETPGEGCVAAHEAGAASVEEYLARAEAQGRAGLTPFFYVPSGIEIDRGKISSDDPREAIASAGAIVSTDTREFEDGAGATPGWLSGVIYIVQGDDGAWRFAGPGGS